MQIFVMDGVLQAASLLVHLPVLGQLLTLLIQLSQTLLQLSNLSSNNRAFHKEIKKQECNSHQGSTLSRLL